MTASLKGTRVLVVGASGGIGGALVDASAADRAEVAGTSRAELDITDDRSVDACFASAPPFDHVAVAAAWTKSGSPLHARLGDAAKRAMVEEVAAYLPVRRIGRPEDVGAAVSVLATNLFVAGSTLTVNGGGTVA